MDDPGRMGNRTSGSGFFQSFHTSVTSGGRNGFFSKT